MLPASGCRPCDTMARTTMQNLSQEQARSLFEAGGFLILQGLPAGSEFGLDGGPIYSVGDRFEVLPSRVCTPAASKRLRLGRVCT